MATTEDNVVSIDTTALEAISKCDDKSVNDMMKVVAAYTKASKNMRDTLPVTMYNVCKDFTTVMLSDGTTTLKDMPARWQDWGEERERFMQDPNAESGVGPTFVDAKFKYTSGIFGGAFKKLMTGFKMGLDPNDFADWKAFRDHVAKEEPRYEIKRDVLVEYSQDPAMIKMSYEDPERFNALVEQEVTRRIGVSGDELKKVEGRVGRITDIIVGLKSSGLDTQTEDMISRLEKAVANAVNDIISQDNASGQLLGALAKHPKFLEENGGVPAGLLMKKEA